MSEVTAEQRRQEVEAREDYREGLEEQENVRREAVKRIRVTRQLVLRGIGHREQVDTPEFGDGSFLVIRPLSDAEFVEVQRVILGDMSTSVLEGPDLKVGDMVTREQKGKYLAVCTALNIDNEDWTPEDIGLLPVGVPDRLYTRLAEISGFPRPPKPEPPAEVEPTG